MASAEIEEVLPGDEALVVTPLAEATWLDVDDLAQVRQRVDDRHHLVRLLLVLGQMHRSSRVGEEVFDLRGGVGRVEAHRDGPDRHRGHVEDHPLGTVLGMDRDPVALVHPESEKTVSGIENGFPVPGPGDLLPDPEVLLPHRHAVRMVLSPLPDIGGRCLETDVSRRRAGSLQDGRHPVSSSKTTGQYRLEPNFAGSIKIELWVVGFGLWVRSRSSTPTRRASALSSRSAPGS